MIEAWLIDGYNLHHSHPGPSWLEQLASFAGSRQQPMLVVLDGHGDASEFEKYKTSYFHVVYSQDSSADQVIERTLYQNRQKAHYIVVTNDRAMRNLSLGLGARVLENKQFMALVKEARDSARGMLSDRMNESHGFHRPLDQKLKDKGFAD